MRMKNFSPAGSQGVRLIIAQVVEKFGFDGGVGVGCINAIHIGPDDKLLGVDYVSDDGAGKIGAIAAKRGDAAVGSCTDETCNHGNEVCFEKRKKNVAAALFGFFQMRLGLAEGIACEDEIGGGNGNSWDAGFFQSGGEKARAEAFSKGGESIGKFGACDHTATGRHFMEKIAAKKLEAEADAVVLLFTKPKILEHAEVEMDDALGFIARTRKIVFGESARNGQETIGNALHRGNHDDDI